MSAFRYSLEHFYAGDVPAKNSEKFETRVLAASAGITSDTALRLLKLHRVPKGGVSHALSVLRDSVAGGFFAVHVQRSQQGMLLAHYILIPSDVIRAMYGNLRSLVTMLDVTAPVLSPGMQALQLLMMPQTLPLTNAEQSEDILKLLDVVRSKIAVVEEMLGAIVQGVRLVVVNAPVTVTARTGLVEGLLSLLPPSVRFAVTFAGDAATPNDIDAQICFAREVPNPADLMRFDWKTGELLGTPIKDEYSKFITRQLRLSIDLVNERTREMTPAAGWYLQQGHRLADALAYGSRRLALDSLLADNQPISKEDTAEILRNDPTLSDSQKMAYARHLLKMSIGMQAAGDADPIADLFAQFPDLERETLTQMVKGADEGGSVEVFQAISHWFTRGVELPMRARWLQLLQRSALLSVRSMAEARDLSAMVAFMDNLNGTSQIADMSQVSKPLLEIVVPFATQGADLAERVFLLIADMLDFDAARRFLSAPALNGLLPPSLSQLVQALSGEIQNAPEGTMQAAAVAFGSRWEGQLLARYFGWARRANKLELLDEPSLSAMARAALSADVPLRERIRNLTNGFTQDDLARIGRGASYQMLRIKLACGDYHGLASLLQLQSRTFYLGEQQLTYIRQIERLFAETPIDPDNAFSAIEGMKQMNMRGAPLAMAGLGALANREPSVGLNSVAGEIANVLRLTPESLSVIPPASMAALAAYALQARVSRLSTEAMRWAAAAAEQQGANAVETARMLVQAVGREKIMRPGGREVLHSYVRFADSRDAQTIIAYFTREFGPEVGSELETTLFLRTMMLGSDLTGYLRAVAVAWRLLAALQALYPANSDGPSEAELEAHISSLAGLYSPSEREEIRVEMFDLMKALLSASEIRSKIKPREDRPATSLDLLRSIGTVLGGKTTTLPSLPANMPLGVPDRAAFKQAVSTAATVITRLARPVPDSVTGATLKMELESLLGQLDREQREIIRQRAHVFVQVPRIAIDLGSASNARVLETNNLTKKLDTGKQRPKNVVEALRFMMGYFGRMG